MRTRTLLLPLLLLALGWRHLRGRRLAALYLAGAFLPVLAWFAFVASQGGGFGFDVKTFHEGSLGKAAMQQHLEGYDAVDGQLAGPVNHTHPPTPDLAQQLVAAKQDWQGAFTESAGPTIAWAGRSDRSLWGRALVGGRSSLKFASRQQPIGSQPDQAGRAKPLRGVSQDRRSAFGATRGFARAHFSFLYSSSRS